ncbi:hydratase [Methylocapsa palsarum]|uniref:Carotenoid 1,2-hydratase n=1 Tax=Methylocapsa palsarum TaxID=1612308 RepID=A0A1I4BBZ5_9HYPH|nr:carotenoid 1,2-hydratase [Methylocapsa palsarum]
MTERGRNAIARSEKRLEIGPSSLEWDGGVLTIRIDEWTAPLPSRIRGVVRVRPDALTEAEFPLDSASRHWWRPIAPRARIEVDIEYPRLRWRGEAYLDCNHGVEPLEDAFTRWDWSRANLREGAAVLYDVTCRNGEERGLALQFDPSGVARPFAPPPRTSLPPVGWGVARSTRSEHKDGRAEVLRTLENAPFYARSVVSTELLGEKVVAMHESLSLDRFRTRWVKLLLPFRMPRAVL